MSEDNKQTRRNVLQGVGMGLGVIVGGSGLAAAETDKYSQGQSKTNWITVENGLFVLHVNPEDVGKSTYRTYQEGIKKFNDAIESGRFRLEKVKSQPTSTTQSGVSVGQEQSTVEQDSQYILQLAEDSARSAGTTEVAATVVASSCNRSDVVITDPGTVVPGEYWVDIYLSDDDIADISALTAFGGMTGPIFYDALISRGILAAGALSGLAAAAITVAVAAEWAWILAENNGCGVKIKTGYSPVNPTYKIPTVESQ